MLFKGKIYAKGPAGLLLSTENMANHFRIEFNYNHCIRRKESQY